MVRIYAQKKHSKYREMQIGERADIRRGNAEREGECDEGRKLDHRQEVTGEENERGTMRG